MKKRLLWVLGIVVAAILTAVLGFSLFLKSYLTSDRLKALIIPRAEEFTGRKVTVDRIEVSLFRGIVVRGIGLKEKDGVADFVAVREFVLDYDLLPLLRKQVVIKRVELISPSVALKREKSGAYNFSDIMQLRKTPEGTAPKPKAQAIPFSLVADRIAVRDIKMKFTDEQKELPDASLDADLEVRLSAGRDAKDISASGTFAIKDLAITAGGIETHTSGTVIADGETITLELNTSLGKETVRLTGSMKDFRKSPVIVLNASANELDLGRLAPPERGKGSSPAAARTKGAQRALEGAGKKPDINASGEVKIERGRFGAYTIHDLVAGYKYSSGEAGIDPIRLRISGGEGVKLDGVLKATARFATGPGGDIAAAVKKTLEGSGTIDMSRCEVQRSAVTDAAVALTGLEDLRSPRFDRASFRFSIRNGVVALDGDLSSAHVRAKPSGTVGFDKALNMRSDLSLSPELGSRMPAGRITGILKDEKGWSNIPLKITGTTDRPSVKADSSRLGKQVEKGITGEIERRFKGIFGK